MQNPRAVAAKLLQNILVDGRSIAALIPSQLHSIANAKDKALAQALVYGVMRNYFTLDCIARQLMSKPLKAKDSDIRILVLLGLQQLRDMRIPSYAAISETLKLVPKKKSWAKGVLNGVLRNYERQLDALEVAIADDDEAVTAHPAWLLTRIRKDWPEQWVSIVEGNNAQAPMTLRVNGLKNTRDAYLDALEQQGLEAQACEFATSGVRLVQAVEVETLPGFQSGSVSVQDEAAQLAAQLLDPQPGEQLLDACAAPGGKTAALLELQPEASVVAMDNSGQRLKQVQDTLQRLQLKAQLKEMDARQLSEHFAPESLDRILLDVPCSATGVIRRNPDIKFHRKDADIGQLLDIQGEILRSAWQVLRPGGVLLYATCSIIRDENDKQVQAFVEQHQDAEVLPINAQWGRAMPVGRQILPGEQGMDGFYYALLQKAQK